MVLCFAQSRSSGSLGLWIPDIPVKISKFKAGTPEQRREGDMEAVVGGGRWGGQALCRAGKINGVQPGSHNIRLVVLTWNVTIRVPDQYKDARTRW